MHQHLSTRIAVVTASAGPKGHDPHLDVGPLRGLDDSWASRVTGARAFLVLPFGAHHVLKENPLVAKITTNCPKTKHTCLVDNWSIQPCADRVVQNLHLDLLKAVRVFAVPVVNSPPQNHCFFGGKYLVLPPD